MIKTQKQKSSTRKSSRIYPLNENYFDEIDCEEKAYFLGFLYADGCNHIKKGCVTLTLQEKDKEILTSLSKLLQPTKPLQQLKNSSGFKTNQSAYRLVLASKHISEKLVTLGCTGGKTMMLEFPAEKQVPKELQRHFIRGYFDGDGYVGEHQASLVGTYNFCSAISKISEEIIGGKFYLRYKGNYPTSEIVVNRKKARKFLDWIYKDSTIYLQRKYAKYKLQLQYEYDLKKLRLCAVEDCDTIQICKNLCQYHYDQVRKNNMSYRLKNEVQWIEKCPNT